MTYANTLLNSNLRRCDVFDNEKMKLFTGKVSNIEPLIRSLANRNCYINIEESDITRLGNGDLIFAFGDKITIVSIIYILGENPAGDYDRKNVQSKTVLTFVGCDDGFVVIDEYI